MERREFVIAAAAGPICAAASSAAKTTETRPGTRDQTPQSQKKYGVKITVLRRDYEKEFVDQLKTGPKAPCARFSDGQEFTITSQWSMPAKFCEWAWADIRTYIPMVLGQGNPIAACCTDGFRPVFFKLERIDA